MAGIGAIGAAANHTVGMSFGQQSGPPASSKQIAYLLSLLHAEGFDFSTARHPYGLTQRQARGKFTIGEASELINRLLDKDGAGADADSAPDAQADAKAARAQERLDTERATVLRGTPASLLVDELERRGYTVTAPD